MPAGTNPALARAIGMMLKNAWLQSLLRRPATMKDSPGRYMRPAVFLCDEYQAFASVGEDDPSASYPNIGPPRIWNRRLSGSSRVRPALHPHADPRPPDTSGGRTPLHPAGASGSLATAAHRSANSATSPRTGLARRRPESLVPSRRPRIPARGDEPRHAERPWLSIASRDHQPRRLAVSPRRCERARCRRSPGPPRPHGVLRSDRAAQRAVLPSVAQRTDRYEHHRADVSHQPTRHRARHLRRVKSAAHAQRFLSVHGLVLNLFRVGRHLLRSAHHRLLRRRAFAEWDAVTCAC